MSTTDSAAVPSWPASPARRARSPVNELLGHWAEHDPNHLEQIRGALRA